MNYSSFCRDQGGPISLAGWNISASPRGDGNVVLVSPDGNRTYTMLRKEYLKVAASMLVFSGASRIKPSPKKRKQENPDEPRPSSFPRNLAPTLYSEDIAGDDRVYFDDGMVISCAMVSLGAVFHPENGRLLPCRPALFSE